jgi:hypothetical protein
MKKPNNKTIAIYLTWGLLHLILLFIAKPSIYAKQYIFPFYEGKFKSALDSNLTLYKIEPFQLDYVYDITEFLFYSIAPILIYYIVTFSKSKDTTNN